MPIHFDYNISIDEINICSENTYCKSQECFIDWNKVSQSDINEYKINSNKIITETDFSNFSFLNCNDFKCKDKNHLQEIKDFYTLIVNIILLCSINLCKSKFCRKQIPGWNDYIKPFYIEARNKFFIWRNSGRPLNCNSHYEMIESRKTFKKKLKYCRKHENEIKNEKIAESLHNNDSKGFWNKVKSKFFKKANVCLKIENSVDPPIIAEKFSDFFKTIYRSNLDNDIEDDNFDNYFSYGDYFYSFSFSDLKLAISKLNPYLGIDNIYSHHLKFAPDSLINLIVLLVNSCLQHSYIPDNVSCGIISPLIKDKLRDQSKIENYRPIMKSSVFLKIFEYLILSKIDIFLNTNDRQHGFKPKHSTTTACYILKETIFIISITYLQFTRLFWILVKRLTVLGMIFYLIN